MSFRPRLRSFQCRFKMSMYRKIESVSKSLGGLTREKIFHRLCPHIQYTFKKYIYIFLKNISMDLDNKLIEVTKRLYLQ